LLTLPGRLCFRSVCFAILRKNYCHKICRKCGWESWVALWSTNSHDWHTVNKLRTMSPSRPWRNSTVYT